MTQLYELFASGSLPAELDALIKRLAEYWRPAGEIIESELAQRRIEQVLPHSYHFPMHRQTCCRANVRATIVQFPRYKKTTFG